MDATMKERHAAARLAEAGIHGARAQNLGGTRACRSCVRSRRGSASPLGDWLPHWDEAAKRAVNGRYLENGRISEKQKRKGLKPETKFRPGERS